jgi:hypothetical protein
MEKQGYSKGTIPKRPTCSPGTVALPETGNANPTPGTCIGSARGLRLSRLGWAGLKLECFFMEKRIVIIVVCLAAAVFGLARSAKGDKRGWLSQLSGWQKIVGVIAIVAAILIMLNPEFLALGLLGDSAFFDMLVFGLSLQMIVSVKVVWRWMWDAFSKSMRWMGIPSVGLRYLMAVSMVMMGSVISTAQKIVHRIVG